MKRVFADASYWIALIQPGDQWAAAAGRARSALTPGTIVLTTDEVLAECLAALCEAGPFMRVRAVAFVRMLLEDPNVEVLPQSRASFLGGLDLYESRRDKAYSLTDCTSTNVMRERALSAVLTTDHHFVQEGFSVLIARD